MYRYGKLYERSGKWIFRWGDESEEVKIGRSYDHSIIALNHLGRKHWRLVATEESTLAKGTVYILERHLDHDQSEDI